LGQAAATLTGTGGSSSLLDKFQKLIKVDDLDVRTDSETGETTVGVGRYVNDQTYIAVERGASPGTGKATIDLSIGRGVKLRGEATETGKNKAGIFYEREY
jgi:translocation and assembly module TamB